MDKRLDGRELSNAVSKKDVDRISCRWQPLKPRHRQDRQTDRRSDRRVGLSTFEKQEENEKTRIENGARPAQARRNQVQHGRQGPSILSLQY